MSHPAALVPTPELHATDIREVLARETLLPFFEPLVDLRACALIGYEGLIRGPRGSPWFAPQALFDAAATAGLRPRMEQSACRSLIRAFAALKLPGRLSLNISPDTLCEMQARGEDLGADLRAAGLDPARVVIELTEHHPADDAALLKRILRQYREQGLGIAIDDLGAGFSTLRLWTEIRPDAVKIDRYFVNGINEDPVKLQFVRSLRDIADKMSCQVYAEGIETVAELRVMRDLGIPFGQGYLFGRAAFEPVLRLSPEVTEAIRHPQISVFPAQVRQNREEATAERLIRAVASVRPETPNEVIYQRFTQEPELRVLPVVNAAGTPLGLLKRHRVIERFSRHFGRELYGRRPCSLLMEATPLIVDQRMSIRDLSLLVAQSRESDLAEGFIIAAAGNYAGIGDGQQLMREMAEMQIRSASHANPLTQLPGNVPIHEHMDRLLHARVPFTACYGDLDHFKPFNDVYGYRKGDEMIQRCAQVLDAVREPDLDFLGHIGGDDFMLLMQSPAWEAHCRTALEQFRLVTRDLYRPEHLNQGGYTYLDRRGNEVFYPLVSLSIGAVPVRPGRYHSHHEIAAVATEVKQHAKRRAGGSLYVEARGGG